MLKAIDESKKIYLSWLPLDKNVSFYCPDCNNEVLFVNARLKIKHFRHKIESDCETEPETEEHLEMKSFIIDKLNLSPDCLEVPLGFGKPDIYIKEKNIAIEVQHSKLSYENFIYRTENYSKNNIYVLWIFDECLLKRLVSDTLKKAHELYFGRIYVYKNANIYPVHLKSVKTWVNEYYSDDGEVYGGYEKFLKKTKKHLYGEAITYYQLNTCKNTWKGNNFLIAKFFDKTFWK